MRDLKHVGILGMKWGVRRKGPASSDHSTTRALKKKHISELSNDELRKVVTRAQLEKQMKDLDSGKVNIGKKILTAILQKYGPKIVESFIKSKTGFNPSDPFGTSDGPYEEGSVIDLKFLKD